MKNVLVHVNSLDARERREDMPSKPAADAIWKQGIEDASFVCTLPGRKAGGTHERSGVAGCESQHSSRSVEPNRKPTLGGGARRHDTRGHRSPGCSLSRSEV